MSGIERALEGSPVQVLKFGVTSSLGRRLAGRYAVRGVPTLMVLDGAGQAMLTQVGRIEGTAVLQAVESLRAQPSLQMK